MDATTIKVGDKVRLRNGETHTVTAAFWGGGPCPVVIRWKNEVADQTYTRDGFYWKGDEGPKKGPRDILEILRKKTTDDIVVKPSHYTQFKIEPVTFSMVNNLDFATGNIVKYALRSGHKLYPDGNGGMHSPEESAVIDLQKVIRYAEMKINLIKGQDVL